MYLSFNSANFFLSIFLGVGVGSAVGVGVDLLTGWTESMPKVVYLSYVGNDCMLKPDKNLRHRNLDACNHYPVDQVGEPVLRGL